MFCELQHKCKRLEGRLIVTNHLIADLTEENDQTRATCRSLSDDNEKLNSGVRRLMDDVEHLLKTNEKLCHENEELRVKDSVKSYKPPNIEDYSQDHSAEDPMYHGIAPDLHERMKKLDLSRVHSVESDKSEDATGVPVSTLEDPSTIQGSTTGDGTSHSTVLTDNSTVLADKNATSSTISNPGENAEVLTTPVTRKGEVTPAEETFTPRTSGKNSSKSFTQTIASSIGRLNVGGKGKKKNNRSNRRKNQSPSLGSDRSTSSNRYGVLSDDTEDEPKAEPKGDPKQDFH